MPVMGPPTPKPVFTLPVEADPLPWLTEQFDKAGAFATDPDAKGRVPTLRAMSATLGMTSSIVSALSDHPKRFQVRFSPSAATASTNAKTREVVIGIRPMLDPRLTDGQRAALMVALANHEVGHIIWSVDMQARFLREFGEDNKPAFKVWNIAHDVLLEWAQAKSYPGYAPTFHVKCGYWGRLWVIRLNSKRNRMGALTQAALYPQGSDWDTSPEVAEWFAWASDWAARCRSKKAGTYPYLFALVREALEHLRLDERDEPDPEDIPPPDDFDDDSESGEDDEWDDDYDEEGDIQDDDESGDGDSGDDGLGDEDEDEDESDEDEPAEDSESDDDDEPDDDTSESGESGDEPEDAEDGESDDDESEDEPASGGESEDDESDDDTSGDDESGDDEDDTGSVPGEDTDSEAEAEDDEWDATGKEGIPDAHQAPSDESEAWQDAIDDFERVQVSGRDKVVVGGGAFHRREVRIIRIK